MTKAVIRDGCRDATCAESVLEDREGIDVAAADEVKSPRMAAFAEGDEGDEEDGEDV